MLQKLLESDDSLQLIAADLSISVRMVQRYVTSIYEKTGADGRASAIAVLKDAARKS